MEKIAVYGAGVIGAGEATLVIGHGIPCLVIGHSEAGMERCRRTEPFQSPEHERRWLLRVAVNKSRNLLRAGRRRPTVPLDEALAEYAPAEPSYRALYEAVLSLPRDYRLTVDLYYYEGYSTGEIAALLGAREATVRTWLRRARLKLKELLKEEWDDDQP